MQISPWIYHMWSSPGQYTWSNSISYIHKWYTTSHHLLSYADDTTIYADSNADILYAETNKQLIKLDDWFRANKLSLNVKKTNYSIFSSTKFTQETNRTLTLNNTTINREHSIRLLGLNIDQQLTWNTHINKLKSKTSSVIFIINRVKKQLPHEALKSIYLTLIHSHCIYGITAWGNSTTTKNYTFCKRRLLDSYIIKHLLHTQILYLSRKMFWNSMTYIDSSLHYMYMIFL